MKEIWKEIEGYEGLYQVSNLGSVKALGNDKTRKEKILKPQKTKDGYLRVGLCKQRKRKSYLIHRLVAEAFIPNPNNYPIINHKDEDKTNNKVENLEFCTPKYNINYGSAIQRRVENRDYKALATKLCKQVLCVETGKIYSSIIEVQRQLGFAQTHISSACRGKRKTAYKFHWQYVI